MFFIKVRKQRQLTLFLLAYSLSARIFLSRIWLFTKTRALKLVGMFRNYDLMEKGIFQEVVFEMNEVDGRHNFLFFWKFTIQWLVAQSCLWWDKMMSSSKCYWDCRLQHNWFYPWKCEGLWKSWACSLLWVHVGVSVLCNFGCCLWRLSILDWAIDNFPQNTKGTSTWMVSVFQYGKCFNVWVFW